MHYINRIKYNAFNFFVKILNEPHLLAGGLVFNNYSTPKIESRVKTKGSVYLTSKA